MSVFRLRRHFRFSEFYPRVLTSLIGASLGGASCLPLAAQTVVSDAEVMTSRPLAIAPAEGGPLFEPVAAEQTGVGISHPLNPAHKLRRLYPYGWATGGVAIGDVSGDGRADLFFSGGPTPARLYIQTGDFQFTDVTASAGLSTGDRWCGGAAMGDIDNDGDLDLYVTVHAQPNLLYLNETKEGRVQFVEKAKEWGVDVPDGSLNAAFADFDRDGWLDLYVQTYHLEPETGRPAGELEIKIKDRVPLLPDPWLPYYVVLQKPDGSLTWKEAGRPDYLLRNNGNQTFDEVTERAGIALGRSYGTSVTWCDVDHNGLPDLLVGNDGSDPDLFYYNPAGKGFAQVAEKVLPQTPWFTRGTVAADFNNDLLIDLLSPNAGPASAIEALALGFPSEAERAAMLGLGGTPQVFRNTLLINAGTARFFDAAPMAGLDRTGATWGAKAADFDNDGRVDAFFANGSVRDWWSRTPESLGGANLVGKTRWDLLADAPERRESNLAYRNLGDLLFEDATEAWGLEKVAVSQASATGDLDGDGDLDLVVCHAGERVTLYRNRSTANRVSLRLLGDISNTWGIGAEVMIEAGGQRQVRQLYPQAGSLSSDEPLVHFGLGAAAKIERLTIRWPGGVAETFENLDANRAYTIREAASTIAPLTRDLTLKPLFAGVNLIGGSGMAEEPSPELEAALWPDYLGRLGPGQAWMDLDGDGKDELYFGGSRLRVAQFVTQSPALAKVTQPFEADAAAEDMGAVFFDADNDGDSDLFVASGGPEGSAAPGGLRDRLYLNDQSAFTKAPAERLPDLQDSGGPVAVADFDRDGDLDLFVGSRLVTGDPAAARNRLLVNDGKGTFALAAEESAPGLTSSGMASGAIWSDIDNDGWLDLLVTHPWGPVRVWHNRQGILADISEAAGTASLLGRWNGIAGGDLDQDGDIDYVVTNQGLNTGLAASSAEPLPAFLGKIAGSAGPVLLETVRDSKSGNLLPLRGFESWKAAAPSLEQRFQDSRSFAAAFVGGLDSVFPPDQRAGAVELPIRVLETGMLINDGTGKLTFRPLPRIAQAAPSVGVVLTDVNFDGRTDAYLVQNLDSAYQSAQPSGGGLSQLLLGSGNPSEPLTPAWPDKSGLVVYGQGRSVAAVDLNGDEKADLVVGLNGSVPATFMNQAETAGLQPVKVSLPEPGRHPAGARVTVTCDGMAPQVAEYQAGGGFLSQSPPTLFFGAPKGPGTSAKISIRWANGEITERAVYFK